MITTIWKRSKDGVWRVGPAPPNDPFLAQYQCCLRYCLVILRHVLLLMLH